MMPTNLPLLSRCGAYTTSGLRASEGIRVFVFLVCALAAPGCATRGALVRNGDTADTEGQPVEEFFFEEVIISASTEADGTITSIDMDVPSLFLEANDYLAADDFENALRLYSLVAEVTQDTDYQRVTHYNMGLANEGLEEWEAAADHYEAVMDGWPSSEDAMLAHFRLAECRSELGQYGAVERAMDRVLERVDLTVRDRLEAHVRAGNALLELRRFPDADAHFALVHTLNERAQRNWDPLDDDYSSQPIDRSNAIIAAAHFGHGRVYHELFREIRFVLPEDQITEDLVDKSELFDEAQEGYLDTVRTGHPFWAPAGGFMVGQLYEDFYYDVLACEVPEDFGELELEIYFEELRVFIQPAMERAQRIYENNLAMSYRLGAQNEWVDQTLASIQRVQDYLFTHAGWEEEQRLVVEQRHTRSARYAREMEFRSEEDESSTRLTSR